jgi:hypothetical protein
VVDVRDDAEVANVRRDFRAVWGVGFNGQGKPV